MAISPQMQLFGVKLCRDNLDWSITPSFIRADHQTQSIHYFHSYAVRDRTAQEESTLNDEFALLLARMLCSNMKYFQWTFASCIDWHIKQALGRDVKKVRSG